MDYFFTPVLSGTIEFHDAKAAREKKSFPEVLLCRGPTLL